MKRRLAAILAADVVGYSRLMGHDEMGTLTTLRALRAELVDPKIAEHMGRIFKATGDGVLAEFPSVVNAVACAVDIQRRLEARNPTCQRTARSDCGSGSTWAMSSSKARTSSETE
ncbi:hypothetical protein [Mesorhizobium sp.]|uniref:adenylate/guanylate cyclase domain-containing protein n=1 Tax=Mesorhizobium sp. TaxID=1871066 RepID=UPI0011FEF7EF|nr:hypothetical protein [Mesorhizobium sp.]TIL43245.1 MAG: adenylate/guanylate cyclase domain-containing protein [Mesorhizobium sp.]